MYDTLDFPTAMWVRHVAQPVLSFAVDPDFEVLAEDGTLLARARGRYESSLPRPLRMARFRQASTLRLEVERADGRRAFTVVRDWDWLGTKPVKVLRADGASLVVLRRVLGRGFLGLGETWVLSPDGRTLATGHVLWIQGLFPNLEHELKDGRGQPVGAVRWSADRLPGQTQQGPASGGADRGRRRLRLRVLPPRVAEVRASEEPASPPWPVVALAYALQITLNLWGY